MSQLTLMIYLFVGALDTAYNAWRNHKKILKALDGMEATPHRELIAPAFLIAMILRWLAWPIAVIKATLRDRNTP